MTSSSRSWSRFVMLAVCLISLSESSAVVHAGTWNNTAGGSWALPANWDSLPNAVDAVADFSTLNLAANATVTLDGNFKVGTLNFRRHDALE